MTEVQEPTNDYTYLEGHDVETLAVLEHLGIGEGDFDDDACYTPALDWGDEP